LRFIRGGALKDQIKKFPLRLRLRDRSQGGGFAGTGEGLNLKRGFLPQIASSPANGLLFICKFHSTTWPSAFPPKDLRGKWLRTR
jgi:hypothetical protein